MKRLAIGAGIAAASVLALTGCSSEGENTPASTPTPTVSTSPTTPPPIDLDKYPPAPEGAIDEDSGETIDPQPSPTWDDDQRADAAARAAETMTAFAGTGGRNYDTWWAQLEPLLTQQARSDYAHVDPANVPATKVLPDPAPQVVEESSGFVAVVDVATDAGTYQVVLTRADSASPWLASRFTPPEEAS